MRIIKVSRIQEFARLHPRAKPSLTEWLAKALATRWGDFNELRGTFPKADHVKVASGKTVVVFNVGGNNFRMIGGVHFNTGFVFILRFMTHAEYDKDQWKETL